MATLVCVTALQLLAAWPALDSLRDWGSFVASGRAANAGLNPYGIYPLTNHTEIHGQTVYGVNLNPPTVLPLFQILALLDEQWSARAAIALSSLVYIVTVGIVARIRHTPISPVVVAGLAANAGLWDTLASQQLYVALLGLSTAAVLLGRRHPRAAGSCLGVLIALKPNFALWLALLLVSRHWRIALWSMITFLGAVLFSLRLYGPGIYAEWLAVLPSVPEPHAPTNVTLFNLASRLGIPDLGPWLALGLGITILVWAVRRRPGPECLAPLALIGSLMLSPIAWTGYWVICAPHLLRRPSPILTAALVLAAVPAPLYVLPGGWLIGFTIPALIACDQLTA